MKRADVDDVVNGCDAGREGELIFAYIMDVAKSGKPVQRLWVSSMTRAAIGDGLRAPARRRGDAEPRRTPPARAPRPTGWWA